MRWFFTAFLLFLAFLCAAPVAQAAPGGPDSIYTGNANDYAPAGSFSPRVRHARQAHRSVRDARGYRWSKRQGGRRLASLGPTGSIGSLAGGLIRASSGATAKVNPQYAGRFQCLVNGLEATGYRIKFMGGYRHSKIAGTNIWSKHASGRAIDINQTGRNRTVGRLPHSATAIASGCGLTHGAVWRHADGGHFEVP